MLAARTSCTLPNSLSISSPGSGALL
jgi:hypothetical protein